MAAPIPVGGRGCRQEWQSKRIVRTTFLDPFLEKQELGLGRRQRRPVPRHVSASKPSDERGIGAGNDRGDDIRPQHRGLFEIREREIPKSTLILAREWRRAAHMRRVGGTRRPVENSLGRDPACGGPWYPTFVPAPRSACSRPSSQGAQAPASRHPSFRLPPELPPLARSLATTPPQGRPTSPPCLPSPEA